MFDVLPHSFFAGRRGICPTCGAALPLDGQRQRCGYCGGESVLERRLVRVGDEPHYHEVADKRETRTNQTRWLLEEFGKAGVVPVHCPGCGAQFDADASARTVTCSHCNTQSRLERRLKHLGPETLEKPQRRNHADFQLQARGKSPLKWDVQTEQLCWRVLNEPDADRQAALAHNLYESWSYTNATLAYFLPWMLDLAARKGGLTAEYIHGAVGKLLCNEDRRLWAPTLDACAQFAFNVRGPVSLLHEIGLGKAIGVKLLIDVAEYAWQQGVAEYACHAAFAVSTLIDRNFDEHPFIGEVMLYRLYYLSGPVLGWALDKIGSGMGGYLFKDAGKLLRFIDELSRERPEIADAAGAPLRFLGGDNPAIADRAKRAEAARSRPEVVAAEEVWDKAGRAALDTRNLQREAMRDQKERVRALDVPIFDMPRDEPATAPEKKEEPQRPAPGDETAPPQDDAREARAANDISAKIDAATKRYLAAMEKIQQEMQALAAKGGDFTARPEYPMLMEKMQRMIGDFQAECEHIHGA